MLKVEQHIIAHNDPRWQVIDDSCFLSKNLYNATLYKLRQYFFDTGKSKTYAQLASEMKQNPDYCALPRKVSQWVLKQVDHDCYYDCGGDRRSVRLCHVKADSHH